MGFFDTFANQLTSAASRQAQGEAIDIARNVVGTTLEQVAPDLRGIVDTGLPLAIGVLGVKSGFEINEFRSYFDTHNEVSKADKFDVWVALPVQIAQGMTMQNLRLLCEASELPGRDINMIEYRHYGFTKRIPHFNQYGQVTFTFYCTGDLVERKLFDRWLNAMVPASTGLVNYPEDNLGKVYETTVLINQYTTTGKAAYTIVLVDAIPISITPMSQNWSDDSVHRLSVTFAFRKWMSTETVTFDAISDFGRNIADKLASTALDAINNFTNVSKNSVDQRIADNVDVSSPTADVTNDTSFLA